VLNPLAAVTGTLGSVASPPVTAAVPKGVLFTMNVTFPAMVPAVVEVTVATNSIVPESVTTSGAGVSVVVVAASTVRVPLPVEAA
jgi:hypothetical protein